MQNFWGLLRVHCNATRDELANYNPETHEFFQIEGTDSFEVFSWVLSEFFETNLPVGEENADRD